MSWFVSTLLRPFLPYIAGGLAIALLTAGGYALWLRADNAALDRDKQLAEKSLSEAVQANESNVETIRQLNRQEEINRKVTADAIRNANAVAVATDKVIQEIERDPHASDRAGPLFDALGDRLRELDQSRHADSGRVP